MSRITLLIIGLVAAISAPADAKTCGGALPGWSVIGAYPPNTSRRPLNAVIVGADSKLRWNGSVASKEQIQQYLRLIPMMNSNNFTILVVGRGADCGLVRSTRAMMNEALKCTPGKCAEMAN